MSHIDPTAPVTPTFDPVEIPAKYAKAIVAILTAVVTVLVTALADNDLDDADLVNVGIAFLTAFAVYAVPNIHDQTIGAWAKLIVAFIGTALQALLPFLINGDVTTQQWLLVMLSAIGALGVGIVPNVNPEKVTAQQAVVNTATINALPAAVEETVVVSDLDSDERPDPVAKPPLA